MRIGIDIDEVVAEFAQGYIALLNTKGIKVEYHQTHSSNFWESFPIPREQAIEYANEYFYSDEFEKIKLVEGAKDAIEHLGKNHVLYFITSRPAHVKEKTHYFMKTHFPNTKIGLVFSGDLHKENGKTKAEICEELGIQIMIEDNKDYAFGCAEKGIKTFLINKPWNKNHVPHKNITKVNHWQEILRQLI